MKKSKRYLSFALALTMIMSMVLSTTAFAASNSEETVMTDQCIEISSEEAAEMLNVPVDEIAGKKCYMHSVPNDSSISTTAVNDQVTIEPGTIHFFPSFWFDGYNVGRNWTCKGTKVKVYFWHNSGEAVTHFWLCKWDKPVTEATLESPTILPGGFYESNWLNVYREDYHFVYSSTGRINVTVAVNVE